MAQYIITNTSSGPVRGIVTAGSRRFLGIPYGEPTGGQNRFRPPQHRRPWEGTRDALRFAPSAPQPDIRIGPAESEPMLELLYPRGGGPVEGGETSEDCLHLNVWAPSEDDGQTRHPVMVWFHGGAFQHGSGNETAFQGHRLAEREDVVVVTVTHRLGALGFTQIPSIKGSANAGILDLVLALEWVRDNIARFGGDPGNVTIFGQSGGSMKVAALMSMPAANGLFHRAIMQSGPAWRFNTQEAAYSKSAEVAVRCHTSLENLSDVPAELIIDAASAVSREAMSSQAVLDLANGMWPGPSIEADVLPRHPFADGAPAQSADIPLLIGSTTHDMAGLVGVPNRFEQLTDEDVANLLGPAGLSDALASVGAYRQRFPTEAPHLLWTRILTDLTFRGLSIRVSEMKAKQAAPVFHYLFNQPTDAAEGAFGSCHSLDLPYVFGTGNHTPLTGSTPGRSEVERLMMRTWATFARSGSPVHPGLPAWPCWQDEPSHAMALDEQPHLIDLQQVVLAGVPAEATA